MNFSIGQKSFRQRQDLNLCGRNPVDFESTTLTTRSRCLLVENSFSKIPKSLLIDFYSRLKFMNLSVQFVIKNDKKL